jgi:hypothetical protein
MREIGYLIRMRKALNMFNAENWQNFKMNKGRRKEQIIQQSTRKMSEKSQDFKKFLSITTINGHNCHSKEID